MKTYEEIKPIYTQIFTGLNGYGISLVEKQLRETQEPIFQDILYGEVSLELLYALYVLPPLNAYLPHTKIFYDLGSGIGNAVISSYLTGLFTKCVGVELLNSLYDASLTAHARLMEFEPAAATQVQFIHADMLTVDFSEADLILFCCPTKDESLRLAVEHKCRNLKTGAIILSLIHQFQDMENFALLDESMAKVAWGETPLRIYQRK